MTLTSSPSTSEEPCISKPKKKSFALSRAPPSLSYSQTCTSSKKINEEVFLDRDGDTFKAVVNYLRNDRRVFPEFSDKNSEKLFLKEIAFWGID